MFITYQLQIRSTEFNTLLRCDRLFQEYCVDKFAQIEQKRLTYFKTKDFQKRIENRQGLKKAAVNETHSSKVSTRLILSSSFSGGPRQM